MDSITQVALGSAVSYAFLGHKLGRRALLVGAAFGTLPDLDVLVDFGGSVENFVYHRSFSHSLLVQLFLSPMLAWVLLRFEWAKSVSFSRWSTSLFFILSTHALLDTFTVYGTQLLWPLSNYPFGISSIFIIDPLYTLPLLITGLLISFNICKPIANRVNQTALLLSSIYLGWSLVAKATIDHKVDQAIQAQQLEYLAYESTPSAFNTFLWRAVATTPSGHYEIYASIFDSPDEVSIAFYPTHNQLLSKFTQQHRIELLQNFTKGLYGVYKEGNTLILSDLRMGLEGFYVFSFVIAQQTDSGMEVADFDQLKRRPPLSRVNLVFDRITDPSVDLSLTNSALLQAQ
ncbi:metal-dependent hydrolase [Pseudoalteromonas piscicida]|uniref:metal-dependent hydrolase n=1 Tax=Pseudoalteromonas piscicida TaxID=43662 RepID=UPI0030A9D7E3